MIRGEVKKMSCVTAKSPRVPILRFLTIAVVLLFSTADSRAQATETMSVSALKNDIRYTEWRLKNLRQNRKPADRVEAIAWQQIREDFVQLQTASDELQKAVGAGATLDQRLLKDLTVQIKKRAARLKRSLPLPAPVDAPDELKSAAEPFEVAVKTLDAAVIRFAGNPVFKQSLVVDLIGGTQAAGDLEKIISLSENLKKRIAGLEQNKQGRLARREK